MAAAGAGGGDGDGPLPRELVDQILGHAADAEDIIEVCFERQPNLRRRPMENGEYIIWKYVCLEWSPSPLLNVDRASRDLYMQRKPDVLQLNRGPRIHFNAANDTIYFDSASFLNLWHYVHIHRWQFGRFRRHPAVPRGNLKGFNCVQTLGWFEDDITNLDIQGFAHLRDPEERVLTGLTNIRLLGPRGYHPGGRAPALGWPLERRLKRTIRDKIRGLRNLGGWTQAQLAILQTERGYVGNDVDTFWDDNTTNFALDLPAA